MELVLTHSAGHVLTITLNRPDKRNAMSSALMRALAAAVGEASTNSGIRVVILRAVGPAFCAGLDLDELAEPLAMGNLDDMLVTEVLAPLEACPKPTLAVVHGDALAGGCQLALHCDLRIATPAARFGMPVARLGLAAPYPLTLKLVEMIGSATTKELLFTGEALDAERALRIGLVNRVVPAPALEDHARTLATTIAANAPIAVQAMKSYVRRTSHALTSIPHDDLVALVEVIRRSADLEEGLRARREKRQPTFRGD
jgi:enoyl-CoA hydratase/carnithine racemase